MHRETLNCGIRLTHFHRQICSKRSDGWSVFLPIKKNLPHLRIKKCARTSDDICTHCIHTSSFRDLIWKTNAFSFDDWGRKLDISWSALSSPTLDIVRYFQMDAPQAQKLGLLAPTYSFRGSALHQVRKKPIAFVV